MVNGFDLDKGAWFVTAYGKNFQVFIKKLRKPRGYMSLFCRKVLIMWFKMHATDVKKDRMEVRSVKTSGVCVSDVIVCLILVIFSVAGFMGGNVILGYLAGVPAVLLFPYLTLKRPFFKADVYGILYRKSTSFGYGKVESIKWGQVEAIIADNQIFSIDEKLRSISENTLNAETLSGLDVFDRVTEEEYEDQAEWIENGIFIVI